MRAVATVVTVAAAVVTAELQQQQQHGMRIADIISSLLHAQSILTVRVVSRGGVGHALVAAAVEVSRPVRHQLQLAQLHEAIRSERAGTHTHTRTHRHEL